MITEKQIQKFNDDLKNVKNVDELVGKNGLITDLFKNTLQNMMEAEITKHLGYPKGLGSRSLKKTTNKRNGHTAKRLRTSLGSIELDRPRDRDGTYDPQILARHQVNTSELERKIISMYGKGMTVADTNDHLADLYGISASDALISEITNKIIPEISLWQNRPLRKVYPIVYIDAIHYKIREDGKIKTKAIYIVIAIDLEGHKDILGIWIGHGEGESAKFWLKVLQDLQSRGVQDILILCCDNLSGISEAVKAIFPKAIIQKCIIHQIRNSLKYIASKDQRPFISDLKKVYKAENRDEAELNLLSLEEKWGDKYGIVIKSWQNNWEELSTYFEYSPAIRKMIYTTNAIEGTNRQFKKVTKNRAVFPSQMALMKLLFLAMQDITKKWTMPIRGWPQIISQLKIHFGDRVPLKI
jgi:transposase-like protein